METTQEVDLDATWCSELENAPAEQGSPYEGNDEDMDVTMCSELASTIEKSHSDDDTGDYEGEELWQTIVDWEDQ